MKHDLYNIAWVVGLISLLTVLSSDGFADPLEYPHGEIVTRVNIQSEQHLTCQHIFHTADSADSILSFYDATLEASGWGRVTNNCAGSSEESESCKCRKQIPSRTGADTRMYGKDNFIVAVNVQAKPDEMSIAQLTVMIPTASVIPFPKLDDGTRLYPSGKIQRFMTWDQQGYITHMYELVCTDPPSLFQKYLSQLMAHNQWGRNAFFSLLDLMPNADFVMLYEKDVRQISVIATPAENGKWTYAIFMKNVQKENHV